MRGERERERDSARAAATMQMACFYFVFTVFTTVGFGDAPYYVISIM